jgi:peptidoglycan/xylan/chitin deacetylase (PgdA/CDA1 family)
MKTLTVPGLGLFRKRAAILAYHRIAVPASDPQLLAVSPKNFEQHLIYLKRHYRIVSLYELGRLLAEGTIPHRAVVLTFDDGYADNLWNAKYLLEKYEVPATIFVTAGFVGKNKEMPSDILERCLITAEKTPQSLVFDIGGTEYRWKFEEGGIKPDLSWNVTRESFPTLRHKCYFELHKIVRSLNAGQREKVLGQLQQWAGIEGCRAEKRIVNEEELRQLSNTHLAEIGSHSINHLVLSKQDSDIQYSELADSKAMLESWLKKPVLSFAYPYGGPNDLNEKTADMVKNVGYQLSCTSMRAAVTKRSNMSMLPRILVRNWDITIFEKQFRHYFGRLF